MKKLLALAALALCLAGCQSTCNDYTIFPCKDKCSRPDKPSLCDCNHKEKCCQSTKGKVISSVPE